jgi:proton-dependent oligopeptide transporter, POT family
LPVNATPRASSDLSRDPLLKQVASFRYIFWVANWIELVERFAYFGCRVGLPVYMVLAAGAGGPELTQIQKGSILAVWAVIQCFVPVLSGGFADRFGYKVNIAISTVITASGYVLMGFTVPLAEWYAGMPLAEARIKGIDHAYSILFLAAMLIAFGTGIFKPGVRGIIVTAIPKSASSLGWGIFYQMVNIGGFIGPMVAGRLRMLDWKYAYSVCAAGVLFNLLPLLFFVEPEHPHRDRAANPLVLLYRAIRGLLDPRLFFFTITFAGFWLMFQQLFDLLPNAIDDWIDSRSVAGAIRRVFGVFGETVAGAVPIDEKSGNLAQEWIVNFNSLLISLFAFGIAYFTGKLRSLTAIIAGMAISSVAIYGLGLSMAGWWILGAIAIFSLGEMMASPTTMRYVAGITPAGKEAQYMGYADFSFGIGWSLGSALAGHLYENFGDKTLLARDYLVNTVGLAQDKIAAIPKADLLPYFEKTVGVDAWQTRQMLWDTYRPYWIWFLFAGIGLFSMVAIAAYTWVVNRAEREPSHWFNTRGPLLVQAFLLPLFLILVTVTIWASVRARKPDIGLALNTLFFGAMFIVSAIPGERKQ